MTPDGAGTDFEARHADWLSWREARARCLAAVAPLSVHETPILEARGGALAEPVVATATLPPWDNAAMDGYAVRAEDVRGARDDAPVSLPVSGEVHAGDPPHPGLEPGRAVRIMTGAPVPAGADSVIRVEHTDGEAEPGTVLVRRDSDAGRNIRPGGQDVTAGETVLPEGHPVTPGTVGLLAALGRTTVPVRSRPRVCIVPTGDELRRPEDYAAVEAGRGIPESNGPMLAAAAEAAGARPRLMDPVPDDRDALRSALAEAARSDVVVTLGGASMGEADLVKRVMDELGYEPDFWRVRMRPGTPLGLGTLPGEEARSGARVPVFGLPGNPSSAFVTFELFVRPALLRMAGHQRVLRRSVRVAAGEDLVGRGEKAYFLRVRLDGDPPRAVLTGHQSSGLVRGLAFMDGFAVVPEDREGVEAGREVEVILLRDAPGERAWPADGR